MKTCSQCNQVFYARGLCRTCYIREWQRKWRATPEGKAYLYEYNRSPERKAYQRAWKAAAYSDEHSTLRAYTNSEKYKAIQLAYRQSEAGKANSRKAQKKNYQKPETKAYRRAWNSRPQAIAKRKEYARLPRVKAFYKKREQLRRSLDFIVLNPELMNKPDFHGHHIDREHVLYIPSELHKSIPHSQKKPETMEKINTKAYAWLLGAI